MIAQTPPPPYYAVIFTSTRTEDDKGYTKISELMFELASRQLGFLGVESSRNELGITVSYWKDLESIKIWKEHAKHQMAQRMGRTDWYKTYKVRISKVERDYDFSS